MINNLFAIFFVLLFCKKLLAYDYQYKSENSLLYLKFDGDNIKEIKFEFIKGSQKNFGIINYKKYEINIKINTNRISFDEFKKFFQNLKKMKS